MRLREFLKLALVSLLPCLVLLQLGNIFAWYTAFRAGTAWLAAVALYKQDKLGPTSLALVTYLCSF